MNLPVPPDLQAAASLAEFGQLIGIPNLQLDAAGCCQLSFDSRWMVTLLYSPKLCHWTLSCFLCASGTVISTDAQHAMLRANFMGSGCAGGCLSIAADGRPTLEFRVPADEASGNALLATIEKLLEQVETWSERVQRSAATLAVGERPHDWILGRV